MSESSSAALGKKEKALASFLEKAFHHLHRIFGLYFAFHSVLGLIIYRGTVPSPRIPFLLSYSYTYCLSVRSGRFYLYDWPSYVLCPVLYHFPLSCFLLDLGFYPGWKVSDLSPLIFIALQRWDLFSLIWQRSVFAAIGEDMWSCASTLTSPIWKRKGPMH